jgi:hypothetical protein
LYTSAVGSRNGAWFTFLERHRDAMVVSVDRYDRQRVHLANNTSWEVADRIEATDRQWYEEQVLTALVYYIQQADVRPGVRGAPVRLQGQKNPTVDDFIAVYPDLPVVMRDASGQPLVGLPVRGDLVRLVRKFPHIVLYDRNTFQLTLAAPPS